jgi:hypothetical protein
MPGAFLFLRCTAGLPADAGSAGVSPNVTYFSLLLAGPCGPIPRSGINKIARGNHPWFQTHSRSTLKGLKKTAWSAPQK